MSQLIKINGKIVNLDGKKFIFTQENRWFFAS
jgi:hypothetical protein